ncbi:MAG TPA: 3-dehydroquinate synthase [Hyphomicrobium sp.]|jgi:shikimate kinase/3-dehydroquinate synthase|uniref:3-dehydroquinate synthase n=1 Tax=Hyphomicrobium sp. TaxID=82 RepID=UPI002BC7E4DF|nr:3-dehydroquinate synthase [Hyphomicrobium sp.]HXE02629.1 3-dehydroquinate synthase [Hyphomicrobium sp.]
MTESEDIEIVKKRLGRRSIVLVGLMGCGKSSVGKRLAFKLGLPFVDADDEIERAAAKSINEIFADHGEALFRDGERKVIARLLRNGPQVLATGGGAYMHAETRQSVRENGISIWLRAELPVLMRRVMKRDTRPLLREGNPEATMQKLIEARYPVYAEADMTVESRDEPHDIIVAEILNRLAAPSTAQARTSQGAAPSRSVSVELGDRSYDVLIASGLLRDAGALIKARLGAVKCGVVTDENVARHHLATLEESLKAEGLFAGSIVMKPGEATKSFRDLATLSERLLELGLERGDLVVPFGGGVIGDLAGFAAGILRRGIRFVQIPTSLLAQVDSSVGGKTGINTPQGKNLIGVFHQPSLVIADTAVLTTLPPRQMRAGYAEVAKYGLLGDAQFFAWLEANWQGVFGNNGPALTKAIETSVAAKAAIVARDETETGERALLNLGHTFGHALEAWTGYSDRLLHGEGVAIGMCMAFRLSENIGICPRGRADRVVKHLKAVGLPTKIGDIPGGRANAGELLKLMGQDKKVRGGKATFILVRDIGQAFVTREVVPETVKAFLGREIAL